MLTIDNMGAVRQHGLYMDSLKHSKVGALMQKNFFEEIFPALAQHTEFAYPYKVGIPKSLNAMLEGDFEPAYTITVTKPVQGIYTQNWFGDTIDGFYLHGCGYVNGDNRYLAKQKLDDADIHMILAGATGQGKSVTLNSIILTACSEYAPWELNLTMCDAKIVEFKTYATKFPMPHIRSIAATGDADYLISVLANLHNEMQVMNSVFTVAGVKNIKSFRKKFLKRNADGKIVYYLALPQTIKAEHDAGKKVPTKYFQKRTSACLRNTNPGSVIGTVIATPIGGCFDLNDLSNPEKRYEFDEKHTDLQYKYHPIEETYIVLSAWYDGKIKEDEVNMGANATTVQLVNTVVAARKNEETSKPKVRAKLVQNKDVRKSLLIPGNYFPAKVYETITYQNLSAKDAAELNYNFESMLKNDDDGSILAQLNESSTNNIVRTATGVTSDVFAEGKSAGPATFGEIPTYYDKTKNLTEVKIAKRDKKASKGKSGVFTYPFIYHKLDDREQGPFAIPEFKKVFDSFHIDEDKFISAVDKSTKTTRTSSSKVTLSNDDFLRAALLGGDIIQGVGSPISKIQENLLDIFN